MRLWARMVGWSLCLLPAAAAIAAPLMFSLCGHRTGWAVIRKDESRRISDRAIVNSRWVVERWRQNVLRGLFSHLLFFGIARAKTGRDNTAARHRSRGLGHNRDGDGDVTAGGDTVATIMPFFPFSFFFFFLVAMMGSGTWRVECGRERGIKNTVT